MERKAEYILSLKTELSGVGNELKKIIERSDKVSAEITQCYDQLESTLRAKQSSSQKQLKESLTSGEIWEIVWNNVWDAIKEFNCTVTIDIKCYYKDLETVLQVRQSELKTLLYDSEITSDEIWIELWNEVWSEFWTVVEEVDRKAAIEIKQIGEELEALELKKSTLQAEIHELLTMSDEVWNVAKEITHAIIE